VPKWSGFIQADEPPWNESTDIGAHVRSQYIERREANLARGRPPRLATRPGPEVRHEPREMTDAERLHLELHGFVVLEGTVAPDAVAALLELAGDLEARAASGQPLPSPAFVESATPTYFRVDNLAHLGATVFDLLTHPLIVEIAEDAVGLPIRLHQSDLHVSRADPTRRLALHRGNWFGGTIAHGYFHYPFCKALTNLTDLGPDDGGTVFVPGSHKFPVDADFNNVIRTAAADPSLLQQVEAPAGSTVVFFESLIHSAGVIRSDRTRVVVVGGYASSAMQPVAGNEPDPDMLATLPEPLHRFIDGSNTYFRA
jgi:hypothetical protein